MGKSSLEQFSLNSGLKESPSKRFTGTGVHMQKKKNIKFKTQGYW